ncbi:hypothetical protein ARMSODRAFT_953868 [Armillaria solidipes]|uniref:Uncharacterized protein n=1 Tax=Armillaria solidipes TaxID=1076256 RepID=A0A2H3C5U9_9AGAR|nr:hypothetical protein ARMSODRAFT_953868 [Armillaria solidipes]
MPAMLKKMFKAYLYLVSAGVRIFAEYRWHAYFVYVLSLLLWGDDLKCIACKSIFIALIWTLPIWGRDEDIAKEKLLKDIRLQFLKLNAYIEDQRASFQLGTKEADAFKLCSSTITQQFLVSKQKAEALYSAAQLRPPFTNNFKLRKFAINLRVQEERMCAIIERYSVFRVTLTATVSQNQLEAAQQWVGEINTLYPPIAADPVDEKLL